MLQAQRGSRWAAVRRLTGGRHAGLHRPIAGAMVLIAGLAFGAKLAVVVKDSLLARQFGVGDALDAFFIAFIVPSFAVTVIAGSVHSAFVPTYVRIRDTEGEAAAARLLNSVVAGALMLLLAITMITAIAGGPLIGLLAAPFDPSKLAVTRSLFYILLPTMVISGVGAIWAAALNAGERFGVAASAPIATPLTVVAAVLLLAPSLGIYSVAWGTVAGMLLEAGLIGTWLARRTGNVLPAWHGASPALRHVFAQFTPMVAAAFLMSSSLLIDQTMAAHLGAGSVSALNYGIRLVIGVLAIASLALGTAVFPYFAKLLAARERSGALGILRTYVVAIIVLSIPLVAAFVYFSPAIIRFVFERGSFTAADTILVSRIQAFYALQIPFNLVGLVGVRFISSLHGNRILLYIAAITIVANIAGNIVFARMFGVAGIALSTTVVYAISCVLIFGGIRYLIRAENNR